jgi:phosphonate transport system permease protein
MFKNNRLNVWLISIACAVLSLVYLELSFKDLIPHGGGANIFKEFALASLSPKGDLVKLIMAIGSTLKYAIAAISLAFLLGLPLGVLASYSFWRDKSPFARSLRWILRSIIALLRSIHELLWAVFLLAAIGLSPLSAVISIAIPYAGILAKVFADIIDESSRAPEDALTAIGASRWQRFLYARLPQAIPDILSYSFYRFECALRSSAILGFFGFPTIGYAIKLEFDNLNYSAVWANLYVLFAVIVLLEIYSIYLRRRLVS